MVFKTFNSVLYYKLESAEGEYALATSGTATDADYIEVQDLAWTVTPTVFERNPTRLAMSPVPKFAASTAITTGNVSAMAEITFSVEMAGSGTAATPPEWSGLMKACGLSAADGLNAAGGSDATMALQQIPFKASGVTGEVTAGASGANPLFMFHKENISSENSAGAYASGNRMGRLIGDVAFDDRVAYFVDAGGTEPSADTKFIVGEVSTNYSVARAASTASGVAWFTTSDDVLGGADQSSVSFAVVLDKATGSTIQIAGARGNCEFQFVTNDRVLMNFTFLGRVRAYDATVTYTPSWDAHPLPPAFKGANMVIQDSTYGAGNLASIEDMPFNSMTVNLGNELVLRENAEVATGYDACYIAARNPTMTWNPDAPEEGTGAGQYEWWDRFLAGGTTRAKLTVGSATGNKFEFKMYGLEFTGVSQGDRDSIMVYDTTTTLTGGTYGSSVMSDFRSTTATGDKAINTRLGTNNEFCFYQF